MKNLKLVLLASFISLGIYTNAQENIDNYNDKIEISYRDSMMIRIYLINYARQGTYQTLDNCYDKFLKLFEVLESKLPDYDYYSIEYEYGKSLKVNRLINEEVFYVMEDNNLNIRNYKSKLLIKGYDYLVSIEFSELSQLKDSTIQPTINTSIGILTKKSIYPVTIKYNYNNDTLTKPSDHFKKAGYIFEDIGMYLGFQFGFTQGILSYGVSGGLGYMHKVKNQNKCFYYAGISSIATYNDETKKEESIGHICLGVKFDPDIGAHTFNWVGYEIGIPSQKQSYFFGVPIGWKAGFSYQVNDNIWLKVEYLDVKKSKDAYGFIGVGIGF
ncbi:MAG: hypothetical protein K9J13_13230 [Saprospiraceae bacterium]|nr:hypothetical protein [Saprospiraceae bacterium]